MAGTQAVTMTDDWWSSSSWFSGSKANPAELALCPSGAESAQQQQQQDADPGSDGQQVGGAAAQNRFNGATNMPIGTTPARDCNLMQPGARNSAPSSALVGGAATHSRFNDRKRALGVTCDGSAPATGPRGMPLFSKWAFDWDEWVWRRRDDAGSHSAIAGRRWGDGRDALGAARTKAAAAEAAAAEAAAPRVVMGVAPEQPRAAPLVVRSARRDGGFSALGGMGAAKRALRDAVVLPLTRPRVYARLGLPPATGVLLHGPPGSGKTALAAATAAEAGVHCEVVQGAELCSEGGVELLKKALEACARKAPCVLFIDDIDAAAPEDLQHTAGAAGGGGVSGPRLATALDELRASKAQVCVVAATSRPASLWRGLRRPGRLDSEVALGALPAGECGEVVRAATAQMPLAEDVDVEELAARMRGYVAADVVGACHAAGLAAVAEAAAQLQQAHGCLNPWDDDAPGAAAGERLSAVDAALAAAVVVRGAHFDGALAARGPAALRPLAPEVPAADWDDIGGLADAKRQLRELIELPLVHGAKLAAYGLPPPRGSLLYGPPGCGKTLLARAAAGCCGANFLSIKGPELLDKWLGGSEANVRALFAAARASAPCVLFFDEIDALAPRRNGGGGGDAAAARVLNQLLVELDGVGARGDVFILAATNRPEALDPAMLRPGRLDAAVHVPLPDAPGRAATLAALLRRAPLSPEVDCDAIVAATDGCSGADLAELARQAVRAAVNEAIEWEQRCSDEEMADGDGEPSALQPRHFAHALERVRRSVSADEAARFCAMEEALRSGGLESFLSNADDASAGDGKLQGLLRDVSERIAASRAVELEAQLEAQSRAGAAKDARIAALLAALEAADVAVPAEAQQGEL